MLGAVIPFLSVAQMMNVGATEHWFGTWPLWQLGKVSPWPWSARGLCGVSGVMAGR